MNPRIKLLEYKDLDWPFHGSPRYIESNRISYNSTIEIDPFPCYHHKVELVEKLVAEVEEKFSLGCPPMWYILSHETTARTNGWCSINSIYEEEDKKKANSDFEPVIILAGKRIPPMKSMSRYLVAHEYGHAVQAWVQRKLGYDNDRHEKDFLRHYAKIRGIEFSKEYGGGKWHENTGEVFANDFRILVCGAEKEFWPHDVTHPTECKAIADYWNNELLPLKHE